MCQLQLCMFCEIPPQFLARLFSLRFCVPLVPSLYPSMPLLSSMRRTSPSLCHLRSQFLHRLIVYTASTCHNPACFPFCPFAPLSRCFFQTTSSRAIGKGHRRRERERERERERGREFLRGHLCNQNLGYPRLASATLARRNVTRRLSEILFRLFLPRYSLVSSGFLVNKSRKISVVARVLCHVF